MTNAERRTFLAKARRQAMLWAEVAEEGLAGKSELSDNVTVALAQGQAMMWSAVADALKMGNSDADGCLEQG